MSLSLLQAGAEHPNALPSSAGSNGQNYLEPPLPSESSEENLHGRDPCGVTWETQPCCRLPRTSPRLKLTCQRPRVSDSPAVQVAESRNPTCECTGLRTSLGHPHQAPLTRSSHQTPSSQTYTSYLLCPFLPTPVSKRPRLLGIKNLHKSISLER